MPVTDINPATVVVNGVAFPNATLTPDTEHGRLCQRNSARHHHDQPSLGPRPAQWQPTRLRSPGQMLRPRRCFPSPGPDRPRSPSPAARSRRSFTASPATPARSQSAHQLHRALRRESVHAFADLALRLQLSTDPGLGRPVHSCPRRASASGSTPSTIPARPSAPPDQPRSTYRPGGRAQGITTLSSKVFDRSRFHPQRNYNFTHKGPKVGILKGVIPTQDTRQHFGDNLIV